MRYSFSALLKARARFYDWVRNMNNEKTSDVKILVRQRTYVRISFHQASKQDLTELRYMYLYSPSERAGKQVSALQLKASCAVE